MIENAPAAGSLYAARRKISPQSVAGRFRTLKWSLLLKTLAIYYFLPFVRWQRGPHEPSQAVLIDLDKGRLIFRSTTNTGPRGAPFKKRKFGR